MTNKLIKKIEIKNFRSIRNIIIDCASFNIFSGLNDTGKSNVLKALNLFFNGKTDFYKDFNFENDYNKNEKSTKKAKEIRIKLTFSLPNNYRSTREKFGDVYLEKIFTQTSIKQRSSLDDDDGNKNRQNLKNQLSRFFSKLEYIYIPAFKDEFVQQILLEKLSDVSLLETGDVQKLNQKIQSNLNEMKNDLKKLKIGFGTNFELPLNGKDFWKSLYINTKFDNFDNLSEKLSKQKFPRKMIGYDIPLTHRGEGIKSKYIPAFLSWYQKRTPEKYLIWGMDEPENSLECEAARELANVFYSDYIKSNQIFITTHSSAFLFTSNKNSDLSKIFRCFKDSKFDTLCEDINNIKDKKNIINLTKELGILEVQQEQQCLYEEKIKNLEVQSVELVKYKKPLLFVEDEKQDIYKIAWLKLNDIKFDENKLNETFDKEAPFSIVEAKKSMGGADVLYKACVSPYFKLIMESKKAVFLFDFDRTGIGFFKKFWENRYKKEGNLSSGFYKKIDDFYVMLLPVPSRFAGILNFDDDNAPAFVEIETLLSNEFLFNNNLAKKEDWGGISIISKPKIRKKLYSQKSEIFEDFKPLFKQIIKLLGINRK